MGISLKDTNEKTKDAATILDEMGIMLEAVEDKTQRAQLANQLFSGRLRPFIELVSSTKGHLREMTREMIAQGVAVGDLTHKRLMEFDSALDNIYRRQVAFNNRLKEGTIALLDYAFGLTQSTAAEINKFSIAFVADEPRNNNGEGDLSRLAN